MKGLFVRAARGGRKGVYPSRSVPRLGDGSNGCEYWISAATLTCHAREVARMVGVEREMAKEKLRTMGWVLESGFETRNRRAIEKVGRDDEAWKLDADGNLARTSQNQDAGD